MDDATTPADEAGMDVEKLDARIKEIERRMESDRERLKTLRARRQRRAAVADGERMSQRDASAAVLDAAREMDDGEGVPIEDLLDEVAHRADRGRDAAEEALDSLRRKGEVYEPVDGEVRVT